MRNIERIRTMDAAQLADFLVDHGAEVPNEFCDGLCEGESCEECPYVGEEGDRRAWSLSKTYIKLGVIFAGIGLMGIIVFMVTRGV